MGVDTYLFIGGKPVDMASALASHRVSVAIDLQDGKHDSQPIAAYGSYCSDVRRVPLQDRSSFAICTHFRTIWNIVEEARQEYQVVYMHCRMGLNRASACASAYLLKRALQHKTPPSAKPNLVDVQREFLQVYRKMISKRGHLLLTNESFKTQVLLWAMNSCDDKATMRDPLFAPVMFAHVVWEHLRRDVRKVLQKDCNFERELGYWRDILRRVFLVEAMGRSDMSTLDAMRSALVHACKILRDEHAADEVFAEVLERALAETLERLKRSVQ